MAIRIVQLGTARHPGEGLRIGTVRRPPRGVLKHDYAKRDFYDVWLPILAPSTALVKQGPATASDPQWRRFVRAYRREMSTTDARSVLDTLVALSHHTPFSMGCYCANESRCHRSVLRLLLAERGARIS